MSQIEAVWHNDGHRVIVIIDAAEVQVSLEHCPFGGREGAECWNREADGCVVGYFLKIYGLECNLGLAPAAKFRDISWTFLEKQDLSSSQVWIMPTEDEAFRTWIEEQMSDVDTTEMDE